MTFLGGQPILFHNFFLDLAFKTISTQMLFWSVFLKTHKKTIINHQKRPKWRFWQSITFLCVFKNTTKRTIVRLSFLKLNHSRNTKKKKFRGVFLKTKNALFWGSKMVLFKRQISNLYFCVCSLMLKEASCKFSF